MTRTFWKWDLGSAHVFKWFRWGWTVVPSASSSSGSSFESSGNSCSSAAPPVVPLSFASTVDSEMSSSVSSIPSPESPNFPLPGTKLQLFLVKFQSVLCSMKHLWRLKSKATNCTKRKTTAPWVALRPHSLNKQQPPRKFLSNSYLEKS